MTEDDARAILKGLIVRKKGAGGALKDLFEETAHRKAPHKGVYVINVDGASRGNPGKAGAGAVIKDPEGRVVKKLKKYLGVVTNNMAEYQALIMALEAARNLDIPSVKVLADSELMVKQINGVYKVKSEDLRPCYNKVKELLEGFKDHKVAHIYREDNSLADSLANEAIDGRDKPGD
ncbi:MAG: ribonuclease HI family protein [Deltaproteobacteria bacterium]|nr:ribonuclease HI family protein [Deltaproteobacteria bacterium]